jgi:hypothetical protein
MILPVTQPANSPTVIHQSSIARSLAQVPARDSVVAAA